LILRKIIFIFFIFFNVCFLAFSQESLEETDEIIFEEEITEDVILTGDISNDDILQNDIYSEESIFIINYFNYNVIGRTLPFVLNTKTELMQGEEITGKTNLIKFIKDKRQLLINERVLKDNVTIEYEIGEMTEDGKFPVDLEIYVEDTWNIIALPYPKYNSNYGLELTIKARDYNFFGSMEPFRVDIGYKYNQYGQTSFSLMLDSGLPFQLFGLNWFFDFDNYFDYRPDMSLPYYYKNRTAISLDIPIKRSTFTLSFAESFILNDENSDSDKSDGYGDFQEGLYMSSNPGISWKIPLGLEIGEYDELTYNPEIFAVFNHELPSWPLSDNRIGPVLGFEHSLYFGRVNWIGNFRQGIEAAISNSYSYNIYYANNKNDINNFEPWEYYYDIEAAGHFIIIEDRFGFSARLSHRHWLNSSDEYAGDYLRGVYDNDVDAEFIVTLNLDLQIRVLRIKPYEWFPKSRLMRGLGFDLHINPVLDCAFYKDPSKEISFDHENFLLGAGFETIIYPHSFRSMFFRISTAWDFSDISKRTPMELFLGMELHY
jgi:hypothetical protein